MTTETKQTTPDFFDVAKTLWPEKDTDAPSVIKGEETLERLYSSPAALEKMGLVKKEDCVSIDGLTAAHMMGYHSRDEDFAKLKAKLAEAKRKLDEAANIIREELLPRLLDETKDLNLEAYRSKEGMSGFYVSKVSALDAVNKFLGDISTKG